MTISTVEATSSELDDSSPDAIATCSRPDHAATWDACIDALLGIRSSSDSIPEPRPSTAVIDKALGILDSIHRTDVTRTPVCITPSPEGGIIIEWREEHQGAQLIVTMTIYNDMSLEIVTYRDGIAVDGNLLEPSDLG